MENKKDDNNNNKKTPTNIMGKNDVYVLFISLLKTNLTMFLYKGDRCFLFWIFQYRHSAHFHRH